MLNLINFSAVFCPYCINIRHDALFLALTCSLSPDRFQALVRFLNDFKQRHSDCIGILKLGGSEMEIYEQESNIYR